MTPRKPHMILHIGAPKCGSSALQTALSMTPDLRAADGTQYRYTAAHSLGGKWRVEHGTRLTNLAKMSAYGYITWPNLARAQSVPKYFDTMRKVLQQGQREGHVPILSCEGWINHANTFGENLAEWDYPPVDVVVFLRPVVDWMNAAFWQWGVWSNHQLDGWMARSNMPYSFADDIAAWAKIPNVRIIVRSQRPDVLAKFATLYDLDLEGERQSNVSSSPALIGFLMRNRKYRPNGHEGANEFIVQRWCPPVLSEKLWAVGTRHVQKLRKVSMRSLRVFKETLEPEDIEDLLTDPRWTDERLYHADIRKSVTGLNDPAYCVPLYEALCAGAVRACDKAGLPPPECPAPLDQGASIQEWDAITIVVLEKLLAADAAVRTKVLPLWERQALRLVLKMRNFRKA